MGKNIARGRRGHLMVLGIDGFRDVNQRMGRSYGNKVLKQIAEILDRMKGEDETIYRLDGDHFAVDLMGRSRKETEGFFQQIQDRMDFLCTFSAGVVCYPFEKETWYIFHLKIIIRLFPELSCVRKCGKVSVMDSRVLNCIISRR